jgi:putative transcriptional regulator
MRIFKTKIFHKWTKEIDLSDRSKHMDKNLIKVAYKTIKGLHDAGVVDKITMRKFDLMCLPSIKKLDSAAIREIRIREQLSQAVFACILNVSLSTVRHWEIGDKRPSGTALKLLNIVKQKGVRAVI